MTILILDAPLSLAEIKKLAEETYGFMIKGSVDIAKDRIAIGGDYHIESCEELARSGSTYEDVWGFNIVFADAGYGLEYDSLINIKPIRDNRSRLVEDETVRAAIEQIIKQQIL